MKELRDIKIDMLTGSKNPIIELFNQITDGIQIVNCDVYNKEGREFIYHKDGEWIFYQDSKNPLSAKKLDDAKVDKFWCNYERYWSFFESQFGLEYWEVQAITKYLVEETLKREVAAAQNIRDEILIRVELTLKREVAPPVYLEGGLPTQVEEALMRDSWPLPYRATCSLEEALKLQRNRK